MLDCPADLMQGCECAECVVSSEEFAYRDDDVEWEIGK
jgi:hypothetical protein